ncbi:MAG: transposase domain-containing protein [Candidatus Riflebacteria bacterium]|nr:transposase domain-containing protein [Candidatus Riflebacteria bacterium]
MQQCTLETAKANNLEPYSYLRYLFTYLPSAETIEEQKAFFPQNVDPEKTK